MLFAITSKASQQLGLKKRTSGSMKEGSSPYDKGPNLTYCYHIGGVTHLYTNGSLLTE